MKLVVLDNEAAQAMLISGHRKEAAVLAHLKAVTSRRRRGATVTATVPAAVRVEAGWDRRSPSSAAANRHVVGDSPLDTNTADVAASIQQSTMVGVADAHVGAVALGTDPATEVVVLTSDPDDIGRACVGRPVTVVSI